MFLDFLRRMQAKIHDVYYTIVIFLSYKCISSNAVVILPLSIALVKCWHD